MRKEMPGFSEVQLRRILKGFVGINSVYASKIFERNEKIKLTFYPQPRNWVIFKRNLYNGVFS